MADLKAEQLNDEFFRTFMPETLYLLQEDIALPANQPNEIATKAEETPAPVTQETSKQEVPKITKPVPVLPKIPKSEVPAASAKFNVIGKNKKGVIVLVTLHDEEFQQLPNLVFLQKILGAIGLQPDDVAYLNNVSGAIARFEDMQREMQVNYIISFASRLDTELPHDKFTLYKPVIVGEVPVVFSQSLKILEQDIEHKKQLWNVLQHVFLK